MNSEPDTLLLETVKAAWQVAAVREAVKDPNTQALLGGVNLRVNVLEALRAVHQTAKLYLQTKLALATGNFGPEEMAALGKTLFDVVVTTLDALRERLPKSVYAACVVLAGNPGGMTRAELERDLTIFLNEANTAKMPFYMGFTDEFLRDALKEIAAPRAFEELVADLRKGKWITESGDRLAFKKRHFVWGVSSLD